MNRPTHINFISFCRHCHGVDPCSSISSLWRRRDLVNVAFNTIDPLLPLRFIQCILYFLKGQESRPINKGLRFCEIHQICFSILWLPHSFSRRLERDVVPTPNSVVRLSWEVPTISLWSKVEEGRRPSRHCFTALAEPPRIDHAVHHRRGDHHKLHTEREREVP